MRAQLGHLSRSGQLPYITVQVLLFGTGTHAAMDSPFTLMEFPDPADPDIVYAGHHDGAPYLDKDAEVRYYRETFARLQQMALPPDASGALIANATDEAALATTSPH